MRRLILLFALGCSACASAPNGEFEAALAMREAGDTRQALERLRSLAERGDRRAQFCLGTMLGRGDGGVAREVESRAWLEKAAAQNHGLAQYYLGVMYERGWGLPSDPVAALRWYQRSAAAGEPTGEFGVATSFYYGIGTTKDLVEAVMWFTRAASHDDPNAQHTLGWMYLTGTGVPKDEHKAKVLFESAARQGHPRSQFNLGYMALEGQGEPRNAERAFLWFAMARDSYPEANVAERQRAQQGLDEAGEELPEPVRQRLVKEAERRRPRPRVRDCTTAVIYPAASTTAGNLFGQR